MDEVEDHLGGEGEDTQEYVKEGEEQEEECFLATAITPRHFHRAIRG